MSSANVLILHGSPGSGKTTLTRAISERLSAEGVTNGVIDADELNLAHAGGDEPRPSDDRVSEHVEGDAGRVLRRGGDQGGARPRPGRLPPPPDQDMAAGAAQPTTEAQGWALAALFFGLLSRGSLGLLCRDRLRLGALRLSLPDFRFMFGARFIFVNRIGVRVEHSFSIR